MTAATAAAPPVNILLVDDRVENLIALEAVLQPLGQNLLRAQSGEEALRRLLHGDVAGILLDVQMPGLDGVLTAAHIKQQERTPHNPTIFLTPITREPQTPGAGYHAVAGQRPGAVPPSRIGHAGGRGGRLLGGGAVRTGSGAGRAPRCRSPRHRRLPA